MRHSILMAAVAAVAFASTTARADGPTLTLRVEPAVAVPLTQPQSGRFDPGGDLAVRPSLGLTPWLDANLALQGMVLPSRVNGEGAGSLLGIGAGLRLKRPHDSSNEGTGFSAASPWIDADAELVGTGPLARASLSLGAGVSVPTGADRSVWVGPFVRYEDIVNRSDTNPGFNNADAHVLLVGLSFEFGGATKVAAVTPAPVPVTPPVNENPVAQTPKVAPLPPPAQESAVIEIHEKVQFAFDSAVPLSLDAIAGVAQKLLDHPGWKVEIQGHASSEGQVAHNDKLSLRRAEAVKKQLVKDGVPASTMTIKGYGSRVPVAPNDTEANRAKNRRVEFVVDVTLTKEAGSK